MENCKICGQEFDTPRKLHTHLSKVEKMLQVEYYQKFHPRADLYDGKVIKFKSLDHYLTSEFNSRDNLVAFLTKKCTEPEAILRMKKLLDSRIKEKNILFAPSTVECRSSMLPSPALCSKLGIDYNGLCKEMGLMTKYEYRNVTLTEVANRNDVVIIRDTREQHPLSFKCRVVDSSLDFGDYTCQSNFKNIYVDRKNPMDLVQSMTKDLDRIQKEIDRARKMGAYLIFLCEHTMKEMLGMEDNPHFKKFTKVTGEYLFHNIKETIQKNDNVQFVFVDGRLQASEFIHQIFTLNEDITKIDIQFALDTKMRIFCAN